MVRIVARCVRAISSDLRSSHPEPCMKYFGIPKGKNIIKGLLIYVPGRRFYIHVMTAAGGAFGMPATAWMIRGDLLLCSTLTI
jgi:hypothetical protein